MTYAYIGIYFLFMTGAATTDERYWTHQLSQIKQRAELKMPNQLAKQLTKREEGE